MRLPTSSVVLKTFFGTEVAAEMRFIIVVLLQKRGLPRRSRLPYRLRRLFVLQRPCRNFAARENAANPCICST